MEPIHFYIFASSFIAGWFVMSGIRRFRAWRHHNVRARERDVSRREEHVTMREQALRQFEDEHGALSAREAAITELGERAVAVTVAAEAVLNAQMEAIEDDTVISLMEFDGPLAREIDDTVLLPPVDEPW